MTQAGRKASRLQEKLDSIQREIARVDGEIKGIAQAVETRDPGDSLRRLRQMPLSGAPPAGPRRADMDPVVSVPRDELLVPPGTGAGGRLPVARVDETDLLTIQKPAPDARFNTYFGTGSLHSVRPLRQERRTQRNRAIFMLVVAIICIIVVLRAIF